MRMVVNLTELLLFCLNEEMQEQRQRPLEALDIRNNSRLECINLLLEDLDTINWNEIVVFQSL